MTIEVMEAKYRLFEAFPDSYTNKNGEFIAHEEANEYFILRDCVTELDVKCKVLEWLSQGAYKRQPFDSDYANRCFNNFMREGINDFLGTNFTADDMELIYIYLGNCCNHPLTVAFVESGYDMAVIRAERRKEANEDICT